MRKRLAVAKHSKSQPGMKLFKMYAASRFTPKKKTVLPKDKLTLWLCIQIDTWADLRHYTYKLVNRMNNGRRDYNNSLQQFFDTLIRTQP